MMKGRFLTQEIISDFKGYLILEERSTATVEKYIRDVKAFSAFVNGAEITKEVVIDIKSICKRITLFGTLILCLQA